jgi:hypothetical protein
MKDLEAATYGVRGGSGNALLKSAGVVSWGSSGTGHDTDVAGLSGASGLADLYNRAYGQKVWSMLNQEVNALAMLAKRPYTTSGWRVLKKRAEGGSGSTFDVTLSGAATSRGVDAPSADNIGGVAENASLGTGNDIPAITPEYTKLFTSPKTVAHLFEFSELALEMAKIDDGVGDLRALVREDMGKHHAEVQNKMLLMPLEAYDQVITGSDNRVNINKNYTSLMKVVASSQEMEAMVDASMLDDSTSSTGGLTATLSTIYGATDRQLVSNAYNTSFLDAEVDFGSGYAAGDARVLTLTVINDMLRRLRENGGSPKVILTGYDTIQHLGDLLQAQERFMDRKEVIPTHNGVRGVKGKEVGFRVATYYDIPIIPCKDMPKTGNGSNKLSDMLILDTDHLWMSVLKPTQYFEDGIDHGNPFGVGTLGNQAMYRTIAETGCSFFKGQGKITNLTSA